MKLNIKKCLFFIFCSFQDSKIALRSSQLDLYTEMCHNKSAIKIQLLQVSLFSSMGEKQRRCSLLFTPPSSSTCLVARKSNQYQLSLQRKKKVLIIHVIWTTTHDPRKHYEINLNNYKTRFLNAHVLPTRLEELFFHCHFWSGEDLNDSQKHIREPGETWNIVIGYCSILDASRKVLYCRQY